MTLVAIGPLTNVAQAIRTEPEFAGNVWRLVIMGGAIATLPDGAGNITPNAEFNYGVSVGGEKIWPGAEGAQQMNVQYDLDWPRFIDMFSERIQRPLPATAD